jgi:hypothetical protein
VRHDGDIGWLHEDEIGVDAHAARVDGATNVQDTIHRPAQRQQELLRPAEKRKRDGARVEAGACTQWRKRL